MTAEEVAVVRVAEKEEESAASSCKAETVVEKGKEEMGEEHISNCVNGVTVKEDADGDNDYVLVDGSDGVHGDPVESDLEKNGNGIAGEDPGVANLEIKGQLKSESQGDRSCIGIVDHDKEPLELCHVKTPAVEQKPGDLVDSGPISAINVEDDVSETSRGDQNGTSEPPEAAVSDSNGDASANEIAKQTVSEAADDDEVSSGPVSDSNEVSLANDSVEDSGVEDSKSKQREDSEIAVAEDGDCNGDHLTNDSAKTTISESDLGSRHEQNRVSELPVSDDGVPLETDDADAGAKDAVSKAAVVSGTEQDDGIPVSVSDNNMDRLPDNVEDAGLNESSNIAEADCNGPVTNSEGDGAKQNGISTVHSEVVSENEPGNEENVTARDEVPVEAGFELNSERGFSLSANTCLEKETVIGSISDECGEDLQENHDSISETVVVNDSQDQSYETDPSLVTNENENVTVETAVTLTVETTSETSDTIAEAIDDKKLECHKEVSVLDNSEVKAEEDNSIEKADELVTTETSDTAEAIDDKKLECHKEVSVLDNSEVKAEEDNSIEKADELVTTETSDTAEAIDDKKLECCKEVSVSENSEVKVEEDDSIEKADELVAAETSDTTAEAIDDKKLECGREASVSENSKVNEEEEDNSIERADELVTAETSDTTAEAIDGKKLECSGEDSVSENSEVKAEEDNSIEKTAELVEPIEPNVQKDADSDEKDNFEKAPSTTIQFGSVVDEVVDEVENEKKKPFYFLIRVPRYDDEDLKEKIRLAQIQVDEKTQSRDAIRIEMHRMRAICKELGNNFDAAISQERVARDLLRSKRQEIESIQSAINIEDIGGRIRNMEHMIQHETLPLKEEKQLIREIKQLKQVREQLSSNMRDEVQQDEKEQTEKCLKSLKKEADQLKKEADQLKKEADQLRDNLQKAEAVTRSAKKKYYDETEKLNKLLSQFKAADEIRQEAYAQLQCLKKQSYERNKCFWQYRDDVKTANELALKGDKEALQSLCVNQVERVMDLWNKNDEFRKEYMRFNIRSTLRRLKTLDGRALGPNEEPPAIPERMAKDQSMSSSTLEERTQEIVVPPKAEKASGKPVSKDQTSKIEKPKSLPPASDSTTASTPASTRDEIEEASEENAKRTKEEEELASKAEELKKEAAAAKLREQRRLEEIAKAKEALERKKRIAEKAQARAVLRAQKEAEQKEKEREKRARKKERRKAATTGSGDASVSDELEHAPTPETPAETPKEEKPVTLAKRSQKPSQFTKQTKSKSIPPPLRNRGKRRLQPWMWVLIVLVILAIFLVGNSDFFPLGLQRFSFQIISRVINIQ